MIIRRLQVEGGFLDGLDVSFVNGLNALIGGRGVGKTAVIELVRFCLNAPNLDSDLSQESLAHALGVLQDGQAILTLEIEGEEHVLSRGAGESLSVKLRNLPLIFSQRELETLARTPQGRLNLVDSFFSWSDAEEKKLSAEIIALSAQIIDQSIEIDDLNLEMESADRVISDLDSLKASQKSLGEKSSQRADKFKELERLQRSVNKISVAEHAAEQAEAKIARWSDALPSGPRVLPDFEPWPGEGDPLADIRSALAKDASTVERLRENANEYRQKIDSLRLSLRHERNPLDAALRKLRQELEEEQAGAGRIAREVSRLEELVSRHEAIKRILKAKKSKLVEDHERRKELLSKLDEQRDLHFRERKSVAEALNRALRPRITVEVRHLVDIAEYEKAITEALRGSNLRYSEISPLIAKEISPSELCDIVHYRDQKRMANILRISEERAARFIEALRSERLAHALVAPVEDVVDFYLLDGALDKHIDDLSIGQRCTVVLSVVLENSNIALVIDQPEDHLDNEFVADTLIKAILSRSKYAQTIVSTHNANIPVLGGAEKVIQLDSNGHRGYVKNSGGLDSQAIVDGILNVMEGGDQAFASRAEFYEGEG